MIGDLSMTEGDRGHQHALKGPPVIERQGTGAGEQRGRCSDTLAGRADERRSGRWVSSPRSSGACSGRTFPIEPDQRSLVQNIDERVAQGMVEVGLHLAALAGDVDGDGAVQALDRIMVFREETRRLALRRPARTVAFLPDQPPAGLPALDAGIGAGSNSIRPPSGGAVVSCSRRSPSKRRQ